LATLTLPGSRGLLTRWFQWLARLLNVPDVASLSSELSSAPGRTSTGLEGRAELRFRALTCDPARFT